MSPHIEIFADYQALVRAAAEEFAAIASRALAASGSFSVALSGGSTPRGMYDLLAGPDFGASLDWPCVHFFWGDERCVPAGDPQSNYRMTRESLLKRNAVPIENLHRIHGEQNPAQAAAAYEQELRGFFGSSGSTGPPRTGFDLVLLGMGENGHTASLFPGLPAVTEPVRWVMAQYVEAARMWRITLTPVVINAAKNILFLVSGTGKAERLRDVLEGPLQPQVLPAQAVQPARGRLVWFVDSAAARLLRRDR